MESAELNLKGDFMEDMHDVQLFSLGSPDMSGVFGEPEMLPRVGEPYQAEIPPLIGESSYLSYMKNITDAENGDGVPCGSLMGLPIPVVWINKSVQNTKHETMEFCGDLENGCNGKRLSEFEFVSGICIYSEDKDTKLKVEPLDISINNGGSRGASNNSLLDGKIYQYRNSSDSLVPDNFGEMWSEIEKASFLLGLYIFEKNFVQVKRFVESKKMGDILSFYYGRFYRSDDYCRWSECRKMRRSRCVYGQRIFTGLRQQELLSRLLPHVSNECKNALLQVSRTFGEGKVLLEEYVSSLKAMVGMSSLVKAVGIGKGKQDLTGMTMEPLKSNQASSMRQDVPIGKACSSLVPAEIIKFLTGGYRLSKARSSDLFWEAVWPRLLARGWHSEQPKSQSYSVGSKNSLMFLMPGIKKFSRRRLVKGNHYFDSVSDVLSKVASEPGLLELESEEDQGNRGKEGNGLTNGLRSEEQLSDRPRHCYLQPRTPIRCADDMKFTVVDTSLADGRTFKVRELRTLPLEISKRETYRSHSEDGDGDSSELSSESKSVDAMELDQEETNNPQVIKQVSDWEILCNRNPGFDALSISKNNPDSSKIHVKNSSNNKNLCEVKKPRKAENCKQDNLDHFGPVTKRRRRLTACSRAETSRSMIISFTDRPRLKQDKKNNCCLDAPVSAENILSQDEVASSGPPKESPVESAECAAAASDNCLGSQRSFGNSEQWRTLIDLNLPQAPPDFETGVFMTELTEMQDNQVGSEQDHLRSEESGQLVGVVTSKLTMGLDDDETNKELNGACKLTADSLSVDTSEQQPNMNLRRQGTRNRPPTARALEALASGYLTTSRKKKDKEGGSHENSTSRPSRRARRGMVVAEVSACNLAPKAEVGIHGGCIDDENSIIGKFQFLPEENGGSHLSNP